MDSLLVPQGQHHQRVYPQLPIVLMANAGVAEGVIASLELPRPYADARQTGPQFESGGVRPCVDQRNQIFTLDRLDDGSAGPGQPLASFRDDPHDGLRIETRGGDGLLDFEDGLEELGIQTHFLLRHFPLGNIELGAQIPDLATVFVSHRLPGAGAPPDLPGPGDHAVLLIPQRVTVGQPLPLSHDGRTVLRMDVLEKVMIPKLIFRVAREPLKGGIHELEPPVHVVGDDPLPHGSGHGLELAPELVTGLLGVPPAPAFAPQQEQQRDHQRNGDHGKVREFVGHLHQWDHKSKIHLVAGMGEDGLASSVLAGDTRCPYSSPMAFLDTKRDQAAFLIFVLGLGLVWTLWPYSTGLIGAPVLYVVFAPVYRWLSRRTGPRLAAALVVLLGVVLVLGPGVSFVGVIAGEAQDMATGVIRSPLLTRLRELRIGPYDVGAQIEALGSRLVSFIGASALGLIGTATRLGIQLTITFFGLFYLLLAPEHAWRQVQPFIPFSRHNAEILRERFRDVTISTLVGTGLTATVQGLLVGLAFWVAGIPNALFWGVVTVVLAILPVVGSGLVWGPGVLSLALEGHYGRAIGVALWGVIVVGNVDNVIRPMVFRRWAKIHPFITIIGAFAGIQYFGLLGLLIGPLAISYFFELIRMYRAEYLQDEDAVETFAQEAGGRPEIEVAKSAASFSSTNKPELREP